MALDHIKETRTTAKYENMKQMITPNKAYLDNYDRIFRPNKKKIFVAVYTNECKQYCDEQFFKMLGKLPANCEINIADNSINTDYVEHGISKRINENDLICEVTYMDTIPREPKESLFQRNVAESVNRLRKDFLKSDCDYFLILESDVIPPDGFLDIMIPCLQKVDAVGALYHRQYGAHSDYIDNPEKAQEFKEEGECLSGCTLYSRKIIEEIPFRFDPNCLGAFPDTIFCFDARQKGFKFGNCQKIICDHLTDSLGLRGQQNLR